MECQSTQAVLEGKESLELLYVEKNCQRQYDSVVMSFQLLLIVVWVQLLCRCSAEEMPHAAAVILEAHL